MRAIDPFADSIVAEPRAIEPPVASLNKEALDELLDSFRSLTEQPLPRLTPPPYVRLVTSAEPGYGKSHLLGRLFQKLDDDATLIYLRPFQDAGSCWISLLAKIVAELDFPDQADKLCLDPGDVTQLDTLARRVLVNLVQRLLKAGKIEHNAPARALKFFERFPNAVFETPEWRTWLHDNERKIPLALDKELRALGIQLYPNNTAWLKTLFAYAFGEQDQEKRQIALDWLSNNPLDLEEAKTIGLRQADLPQAELTPEARNEAAFERIRDLFKLASFYRPFLLCFDQTELYDSRPELAHALGVVLSRLRRETVNHLAIVTANQFVWKQKVFPQFETADQHCFAPNTVHLQGMTRDQAQTLVQQRLKRFNIEAPEAEQFPSAPWLDSLFGGEAKRQTQSARSVLRAASQAWGNHQAPNIATTFESYRRKLLADPKRLEYDAGVFQWILGEVLGPAAKMDVRKFQSARGYLTLRWQDEQREALFGFEPGQAWKRWEAILNEATKYHQQGKHEQRSTSVRFFRTPLQRPLPARNKKQLERPANSFFRVLHLEREDAATIYAAHDFYADVAQGNQEFQLGEVVAYLRERMGEYVGRIIDDTDEPPPSKAPSSEIRPRLVEVMQAVTFITMPFLLDRLKDLDVSEDQVLTTCASIRSIRVFSSPQSTVVQWIPSH